VRQEENPLASIEIALSLGYDFESKASTSTSSLPLYTSSSLTPPLPSLLPSLIDSLPIYNNISQLNPIQAEQLI